MNTKIRFGLGILGGILVAMGAAFYISHASSATDSSNMNHAGAIITPQSSMPNYLAFKDSAVEFVPSAAINFQNLSAAEYFAKDLQLEYNLDAVMVVTASNLSEEAQYFAQDLYTEYGGPK
jgi:3-oxoacyl-ACP reductase-like protein